MCEILKIYSNSFKVNEYTSNPFRMIGTIDVDIKYDYGIEKVTLAYFRSSGTNSGKKKGLWYPIVGIKLFTGEFEEFTNYINLVLKKTTKANTIEKGWLAKSLFFYKNNTEPRGFGNGIYHDYLYWIGISLMKLYENNKYSIMYSLNKEKLNNLILSHSIYDGNNYSQRKNFERFIKDILTITEL